MRGRLDLEEGRFLFLSLRVISRFSRAQNLLPFSFQRLASQATRNLTSLPVNLNFRHFNSLQAEYYYGYAMLMSPNKGETAVHDYHCQGDMAVRMREVLARPGVYSVCAPCFKFVL